MNFKEIIAQAALVQGALEEMAKRLQGDIEQWEVRRIPVYPTFSGTHGDLLRLVHQALELPSPERPTAAPVDQVPQLVDEDSIRAQQWGQ